MGNLFTRSVLGRIHPSTIAVKLTIHSMQKTIKRKHEEAPLFILAERLSIPRYYAFINNEGDLEI